MRHREPRCLGIARGLWIEKGRSIPFHSPSAPPDNKTKKTHRSYGAQRSFDVSPAIFHGSLAERTILSRECRNDHSTCTWVLKHTWALRKGGVVRFEELDVLGCFSGDWAGGLGSASDEMREGGGKGNEDAPHIETEEKAKVDRFRKLGGSSETICNACLLPWFWAYVQDEAVPAGNKEMEHRCSKETEGQKTHRSWDAASLMSSVQSPTVYGWKYNYFNVMSGGNRWWKQKRT